MAKPSAPARREGSPLKRIAVLGTAPELIAKLRRVCAATMIKDGPSGPFYAKTTITTAITGEGKDDHRIAQIDVKPGTEAEFENGVKQAVPIFKRARGCRSMEWPRSTEKPSRYRLFVGWDTVENHTVDFRGSADFQEWRKLVAHCFASPPDVEHVSQVVKAF